MGNLVDTVLDRGGAVLGVLSFLQYAFSHYGAFAPSRGAAREEGEGEEEEGRGEEEEGIGMSVPGYRLVHIYIFFPGCRSTKRKRKSEKGSYSFCHFPVFCHPPSSFLRRQRRKRKALRAKKVVRGTPK